MNYRKLTNTLGDLLLFAVVAGVIYVAFRALYEADFDNERSIHPLEVSQ